RRTGGRHRRRAVPPPPRPPPQPAGPSALSSSSAAPWCEPEDTAADTRSVAKSALRYPAAESAGSRPLVARAAVPHPAASAGDAPEASLRRRSPLLATHPVVVAVEVVGVLADHREVVPVDVVTRQLRWWRRNAEVWIRRVAPRR